MSVDEPRAEHLRVIADSVPALLSYVDDQYRYRWANRRYQSWFGQRSEDICGQHVHDVLGLAAWEAVRPYMDRALAGEEVTYEQELPYRGSGPRWVRVTYTPDGGPDGRVRGFSVLVHDIGEQKRAQERNEALSDDLRARVEELRRLIELLPVGVFIGHDPECKTITMNPAGAALLGLPPGGNPSKTGPDADTLSFRAYQRGVEVAPDELPMQRAAREDVFIAGEELEIERADGSRVDLWLFVSPLYDRGGAVRGALGAFVDTTERAAAEATLRAREEQYRTLFELASVGAAQVDVASTRFLRVNQRFCEITGYSEAELLARTFADITHPADRERDLAAYEAAVHGSRSWQSEKRYVRSDGTVVWALVIGRVVAGADGRLLSIAHIIDITARKRAEQALHEAEERFRVAQELSLDGFSILRAIRDERGVVIDFAWEFVNPTAARWLRHAPEELVGGRLLAVLPSHEASSQLFRSYVEVVESGRSHDDEVHYDAGGMAGWFRNMAVRIGDGVAVSFTDITERKALEERLQSTVAELQREHRRKDEFLAMLAHELRNPLAAIGNAVQLLQMFAEPRSEAPRGVIERQVRQLTRLVDDLLDVSRITGGKVSIRRERVRAASVAEAALEMSRPLLERMRHELVVRIADEPLELDGDPVRLAQAVTNLLHNAGKYTDPGGHVQLVVEPDGDEVVFRVIDDGVGIPAEMLPRVFDLFAQVDRSTARAQGGLGIGLTVVRSLVELHGGRVEAHSEGLGHGSEMVLRLPRAAAATHEASPSSIPDERAAAPSGLRVLVVDDNADAARTLGDLLRAQGHVVEVALDGPDGLARADRLRPDLVLLDLGMPGMDGFEVARRLRAGEAAGALIVALTGWGDPGAQARAREAGFDRHVVKPPSPELLGEVLRWAAERGPSTSSTRAPAG